MQFLATQERGIKQYELTDHLGNIRTVVGDIKEPHLSGLFRVRTQTLNNYYPYGMLQSGRSVSTGAYRFGFNGMENDNKKGGLGEHIDFGARGLNTWTGKFYGIDPLWAKYPNMSSYASMGNNPILMRDFDGRENMVYVVFLPSSKLSPTEKQAVIAEMQRIYTQVIGLSDEKCNPLVKVREFSEKVEGKMEGKYLDASDVAVGIGSVSEVNNLRSRVGYSVSQIKKDSQEFLMRGNTNPESSEQKGETFGKFVGIATDRVFHPDGFLADMRSSDKFQKRPLTTATQAVAYLATHGSGHNVGLYDGVQQQYDVVLRRDGGGYYTQTIPHSYFDQIMNTDYMFSLGLPSLLSPSTNGHLFGAFNNKFSGTSPQDNYQSNKRNKISTPIK